ncbi:MAG: LD-carboxypeptidase [Desulfobacula sp.]|jgi:muramoyltetrapeptide carboxypeptidase|uniref:S66 peptidase family protein n=1 Tax=Desulfobacula sp. TaxID=2593537 RepID=UPI001D4A48D5|nr:LD-carboxypeptidase [Desulfobacula sp.]MBT3485916.1 LD-carboxypeptidase [Desulfobacula sp.]MBT3805439.1 LD-carboxypeptidase [Desulfobacula sp.]MBT4025992.1 LD-carboxypeptidase [Desulfobacula sp.]MBT4199089.1 LD-carboxypeptidase [Desulfobacula sp.]
MKRATPLLPGSRLGVCAPSARFDTEKLNSGIQIIEALGFKVKVPEEIFKKKRYLAGDDIVRANVVNDLFQDPAIDGIICARGGFGALRILDHLNWNIIKQNPKPFIGFSDNTAILLAIIDETGNSVIHGPNVVSFAHAAKETIDAFYKSLNGSLNIIDITNGRIIRPGMCKGILKGGNMATISHLLGTRFQSDFKDAVLFFEDIGEPAYKIDRMLTQMKMAGLFNGIRGVITGSFENCDNYEYLEEILYEIFEGYNVPVLSGLDSGHGKVNLSLNMGARIKMDTKPARIYWS